MPPVFCQDTFIVTQRTKSHRRYDPLSADLPNSKTPHTVRIIHLQRCSHLTHNGKEDEGEGDSKICLPTLPGSAADNVEVMQMYTSGT